MKKGFTLIELLVVLTVLALGLVLAYPSFGRMSQSVELKAAAKKVSSILRYYRSEAVQKGRVFQVVLDVDTREIRVRPVETEENKEEGEKSEEKDTEGKGTIPFAGRNPGEGDENSRFPISLGLSRHRVLSERGFQRRGLLSSSGKIQKSYRIQVNFLTGVVEIKEG